MPKKKIFTSKRPPPVKPVDTIKREKWKNGYHNVLRGSKGRFIGTSKWAGKKSRHEFELKYQQKFLEESRFVYVVDAKSDDGRPLCCTISSPVYINMGGKNTKQRKWLYENIRKKYSRYNFDINSMKLMDTWDKLLHRSVRA